MMALPLTPDVLQAAYEFIRTTKPFRGWNLPEGDDVKFKVVRTTKLRGWYDFENGHHTIAISAGCISHTSNLIATMAHEVIHLHQRHCCMETSAQHNAAFKRLAATVCKVHGYDPMLF